MSEGWLWESKVSKGPCQCNAKMNGMSLWLHRLYIYLNLHLHHAATWHTWPGSWCRACLASQTSLPSTGVHAPVHCPGQACAGPCTSSTRRSRCSSCWKATGLVTWCAFEDLWQTVSLALLDLAHLHLSSLTVCTSQSSMDLVSMSARPIQSLPRASLSGPTSCHHPNRPTPGPPQPSLCSL